MNSGGHACIDGVVGSCPLSDFQNKANVIYISAECTQLAILEKLFLNAYTDATELQNE